MSTRHFLKKCGKKQPLKNNLLKKGCAKKQPLKNNLLKKGCAKKQPLKKVAPKIK